MRAPLQGTWGEGVPLVSEDTRVFGLIATALGAGGVWACVAVGWTGRRHYWAPEPRRYSVEEVEVLAACLHGVNHELVAAVEAEHDDLEEAAGGVESEAQLPGRAVIVKVADEHGMLGGMDGVIRRDSVPASGVVDLHAT